MELTDDKIDTSEWLSADFAQEYPHRASHITRRNDSFENDASKSPLDLLLAEGYISEEHHRIGFFIMNARRMLNHKLGTDKIRDSFRECFGFEVDRNVSPEVVLVQSMRGLKPYERNIIDRIASLPRADNCRESRPLTERDLPWIRHCLSTLRHSLDAVKKNLDELSKSA